MRNRVARRLYLFQCHAPACTLFAGTRQPGVPGLPCATSARPLAPSPFCLETFRSSPLLQSRMSEVFGVDIHPAARIGWGVMMDHATGARSHQPCACGAGLRGGQLGR